MLIFSFFAMLFVKIITKKGFTTSSNHKFNNLNKSIIQSFIIIALQIIINIIYLLIIVKFYRSFTEFAILLTQFFMYFISIAIVILVVLHNKESFQSVGITKLNLIKSCILGVFLGITFFLFYEITLGSNNFLNILSLSSLISFMEFLIVGFSEEILYRGYLQTRLIAWRGTLKGCFLTAVIFSFCHLPNNLLFGGMNLQDAFFNCINLIPLSIMFGYIMIKTNNIFSVSILHTFIDWTIN